MKYSDIQLSDKAKWREYKQAWGNGDYATALATELAKKKLTAETLNDLTDYIVAVEKLDDPDYDVDKIKVETQVPDDLPTGKVYFEWTNPPSYTWAQVDARNYTFADVDALNITWEYANRKGW